MIRTALILTAASVAAVTLPAVAQETRQTLVPGAASWATLEPKLREALR